jgi:hypothetical protein
MTIYIHNWKGEWVRSSDNYPFILRFHLMLARCRIWQLIIIPKHILLGAYYGYIPQAIYIFERRHLNDVFNSRVC